MRVVSLLPAATEIVAALGLTESLVAVSHECNYPPEVNDKPRVTQCEIYGKGLPSAEVDRWVNKMLASKGALYTIDESVLRSLDPDVIVTQQLCDVCAIDYASVVGVANSLPKKPKIVNLSPSSLADVFDDIRRVAAALGVPERGEALVASLVNRVKAVKSRASGARSRPRCIHMEWIDPPFCGGHWNPELVEIAGGVDPIGRKGAPSIQVPWSRIVEAEPEILVLACCGYEVERTLADIRILQTYPNWDALPAVRSNRVYAVNGSAYFSRPGPRIVSSLEILAQIIHPQLFSGYFPRREVVKTELSQPISSI
jgi:iron complex transport system substrate-binding protein